MARSPPRQIPLLNFLRNITISFSFSPFSAQNFNFKRVLLSVYEQTHCRIESMLVAVWKKLYLTISHFGSGCDGTVYFILGRVTCAFSVCWKILVWVKQISSKYWYALNTQQNSYSISHLLDTVTTQWLDVDSDGVVTVHNCRQHGVYTAIDSSVTVLPAVVDSDYTITIQSLCSHCV